MDIGDLVQYQGSRWRVLTHVLESRVYMLASPQGKVEAPEDAEALEDLRVICNPGREWPFVAIPILSRGGPITAILRGAVVLTPMVDWVPSDFVRPGGTIFFNPALSLRTGEVLSGVHKDKTVRSRISITPSFGSGFTRKKRAQKKPVTPQTSLDHIIGRNPFEDD